MTGYWVAVVVEDWRYRMLPPIQHYEGATPAAAAVNSVCPSIAEARRVASRLGSRQR